MMDADLVVADINADGRADPIFLVSSTAMAGQPTTNCYQGNDDVTYCPHWELTVGIARDDGVYDWETQVTTVLSSIFQLQHSVLAGDLDGDGRDDLVIVQQAQSGSKVTSVRNVGTGSMRWSLTGQNITGLTDQSVLALGDTDTDGIAELLVAYPHVNNNTYCGDAGVSGHYEVGSALPMQADNTFFTATNIDENFQCGRSLFAWPELAEVNGDGRTDWIGL